jgi:hypothetical protein
MFEIVRLFTLENHVKFSVRENKTVSGTEQGKSAWSFIDSMEHGNDWEAVGRSAVQGIPSNTVILRKMSVDQLYK